MKYQRKSTIITDKVGIKEQDDIMIQDKNGGRLFIVNWSAGYLLQLLESPCEIDDLWQIVSTQYQVDKHLLKKQIEEMIDIFIQNGWVDLVEN